MKKMYGIYLLAFAAITIAAIAVATVGVSDQKQHVYVMPEGYTGWVEVRYEQEDYPELPLEEKAYLHAIPDSGVLNTSSPPTSGGMMFYYADEQGNRSEIRPGMIHGQSMGTKQIQLPNGATEQASVNSFYIGTEQQYNEAISARQG